MKLRYSVISCCLCLLGSMLVTGCGVRLFYVQESKTVCVPICIQTDSKENFWNWKK